MFRVNLRPMDYKYKTWRSISAFTRTKNYQNPFTESKVIWNLVRQKLFFGDRKIFKKSWNFIIGIINIFRFSDFSKILGNRKIGNVNTSNCNFSRFLENFQSRKNNLGLTKIQITFDSVNGFPKKLLWWKLRCFSMFDTYGP